MRVAIVGRNGRQIGGTETQLSLASCALSGAGHDVAFLHEVDVPADRERVTTLGRIPRWCVAELGGAATLDALRRWAPDVVYAHGLDDPDLESTMLDVAPIVFHAHDYYGTCVSGAKSHAIPRRLPCRRRFGASCLALYYPRRCGGLHPLTMWREYRRQRRRLDFLRRCAAIVTSSRYVASEYANHGLSRQRIVPLPLPLAEVDGEERPLPSVAVASAEWRLLFLGRLDRLKGGDVLLNALPAVSAMARRPLRVTFAGDGPARGAWQALARALEARVAGLRVEFVGWADPRRRDELLRDTDLLVVPSVWPEPFGVVGLEAGRYGVPSVAFDVGGIREWLEDGVGGRLAPGNPPTSAGLAAAITAVLRDPVTHARLGSGARTTAARFTRAAYTRELCAVLEDAARSTAAMAASR